MSKVDWSLAPEGAEFYSPAFSGISDCWYKTDNGEVHLWCNANPYWSMREKMIGELIERPKQPQAWSGYGCIPMGSEVEIHHSCWNASEWLKCKMLYMSDAYVIVNHWGLDEQHYHARDITVRPIRIPEQQAADKRETAIRELMDIAQVDCRVTAARLVDAGFKLPSKSESRDNAVDAMELIVPHIGSVAAGKLYDAGFKREVV